MVQNQSQQKEKEPGNVLNASALTTSLTNARYQKNKPNKFVLKYGLKTKKKREKEKENLKGIKKENQKDIPP